MSSGAKSASRYREHAEELRVIAEDAKDRFTRKILLAVAEDYERMAVVRDKIEGTIDVNLDEGR